MFETNEGKEWPGSEYERSAEQQAYERPVEQSGDAPGEEINPQMYERPFEQGEKIRETSHSPFQRPGAFWLTPGGNWSSALSWIILGLVLGVAFWSLLGELPWPFFHASMLDGGFMHHMHHLKEGPGFSPGGGWHPHGADEHGHW
jgi:hypothetical protein